jgi:hypothetical protein
MVTPQKLTHHNLSEIYLQVFCSVAWVASCPVICREDKCAHINRCQHCMSVEGLPSLSGKSKY